MARENGGKAENATRRKKQDGSLVEFSEEKIYGSCPSNAIPNAGYTRPFTRP